VINTKIGEYNLITICS